jgi:hypothetical protein
MYDAHDLYTTASDQLRDEGVDAFDLRCDESRHFALRLVDLCFRMRRNGSFRLAPEDSIKVICEELRKIEAAETQAIFEELEAQYQDRADAIYDERREHGL